MCSCSKFTMIVKYFNFNLSVVMPSYFVAATSRKSHLYLFAEIFLSISAARPRADVAYCIHALARRLSKTRNWAVWLLYIFIFHSSNVTNDIISLNQVCFYGCYITKEFIKCSWTFSLTIFPPGCSEDIDCHTPCSSRSWSHFSWRAYQLWQI